jgi:hypothetical protein
VVGDVLGWRELGCYRRQRAGAARVKETRPPLEGKTIPGLTLELCAANCKDVSRYAAAHWRYLQ